MLDPEIIIDENRTAEPWACYPGNNKIYCKGRFVWAKNSGMFFVDLTLILAGFAVFAAFEWTYLAVALSPIVPLINIILFIIVISLKFRCVFMDPGFIKRDSKRNYKFLKSSALFYYGGRALSQDSENDIRYLTLPIKGYTYQTKYCTTCNIYRPPRSKHCEDCDACVLRMDHHCPWLMNCIGQRNYKYFFCYVSSLTLLICYQFAFSLFHMKRLHRRVPDYTLFFNENIPILVNVVYHFTLGGLVLCFVYYHCKLATSNVTTNEDIKDTLLDYDTNPFLVSRPSRCCSRFNELQSLLCTPTPPSVLDLQEIYTHRDIIVNLS